MSGREPRWPLRRRLLPFSTEWLELSEKPDGPFSEAEGASSPIEGMSTAFLVPAGRVPLRETAWPPALGTIRLARFQAAHHNSNHLLRLNGPVFRRWVCRFGGEDST